MTNQQNRVIAPYMVAAVLTVFICAAAWPGFMSYDSLKILHEARCGITDNIHPVLVIYLQRLFDSLYPGPGLLFLFENALFIFSLASIISNFCLRPRDSILLMLVVFLPPIISPMLVVWKDVLTMAFLLAGFAFITRAEREHSATSLFFGFTFTCLGALTRLNAVLAALPLLAYAFWVWRKEGTNGWRKAWVRGSAVAITLCGLLCLLNTYRLPDGKQLPGSLLSAMHVFDLIGISHLSGELLVPKAFYDNTKDFSVNNLGYFPQCLEYSCDPHRFFPSYRPLLQPPLLALESGTKYTDVSGQPLTPQSVKKVWLAAICKYPTAFVQHRLLVAEHFLGIARDRVHYPTHWCVDANNLSVQFQGNLSVVLLLEWINWSASTALAYPWVYYCVGLITLAALVRKRPALWYQPAILIASGLLMCFAILPVTVAADYRYHAWSLAAISIAMVVWLAQSRSSSQHRMIYS